MTIQQSHDYFDLLVDKVEGAYFTDEEKDTFISQACIEYTKRHLPSAENAGANIELDQINYGNLYTLVYTTSGLSMNSSGVITTPAIQSALNTASGSTEAFMAILGLAWTKSGSSYAPKWTPNNQWLPTINNAFKVSATSPRYKYEKANFIFSPVDTNASVTFTLLKQPKATSLGSGVTIELPDHTHKAVVELAVDLAATAIREPDLKGMIKE